MDVNNTIYLSNLILGNEEDETSLQLDSNAVAVYVALRSIMHNGRNEYYVNIDMLCYELCHKGDANRYFKTNIKNGLQALIDLRLVSVVEEISKDGKILDLSNLYVDSQKVYYTTIFQEEVHKIMNIKCHEDKFKLLHYFIIMMKSINVLEKSKDGVKYVGFMSIKHLAAQARISTKSVNIYNEILESNEIIYIYHHEKLVIKDKISSLRNHYGRKEYEQNIKKYAIKYELDKKDQGERMYKQKKKEEEQQEETRYGISIVTKKENTKVETNDYDDDDVEFWGGIK